MTSSRDCPLSTEFALPRTKRTQTFETFGEFKRSGLKSWCRKPLITTDFSKERSSATRCKEKIFQALLKTFFKIKRFKKAKELNDRLHLGHYKRLRELTTLAQFLPVRRLSVYFFNKCKTKTGIVRVLVIFQDKPKFSHIIQKVSARAFH